MTGFLKIQSLMQKGEVSLQEHARLCFQKHIHFYICNMKLKSLFKSKKLFRERERDTKRERDQSESQPSQKQRKLGRKHLYCIFMQQMKEE